MDSYRCPVCGGLISRDDLYPDPVSGQPMHLAPRWMRRAEDRVTSRQSRTECDTCGPVAMTMLDKQRWAWELQATPGVPILQALYPRSRALAGHPGL